MNTNDFFPTADYKMPETSNYMKFKEGNNKFRVLSSAIVGYQYFKADNKPVRSEIPFDETPDIKQGGDIKHFWAFLVWNYDAKRLQLLELTQKGIMQYMQSLISNPDWGTPKNYDITVIRTGAGLNTEYSTLASPHSAVTPAILSAYEKCNVDLTALFKGLDPFQVNK